MTTPPGAETARPGKGLLAGLAAFVLLFTAAGYAWVGNRAGLAVAPPAQQAPAFAEMVERLATRLQTTQGDAEGWAMLGRSYAVLGRLPEALAAYEWLLALRPRDAQVHADYADLLATAHGGALQGEPQRLIDAALALDPDNLKALALAGTAALRRGDAAAARRHWQRALSRVEPGSELAREFETLIADAGPGAPPAAAVAAAVIEGRVTLAPTLLDRAAPDDTLFVFARAASGPAMPLAILRRKVSDLPLDFRLDDSLAMSPQARLSGAATVIVGARISKSGQALPQPGDLQALSAPLAVGSRGLQLQIGEVVR